MYSRIGKRIFGDLPFRTFWLRYAREVGDLTPIRGQIREARVFEYARMIHIPDVSGRWSLFETDEMAGYRAHINAWAEFARGVWVDDPPTETGTYPVKTRQGHRSKDRTIEEIGDRLIDTTGGFVGHDRVTEWRGQWWSKPYPPLPGAY